MYNIMFMGTYLYSYVRWIGTYKKDFFLNLLSFYKANLSKTYEFR